jgi:hypothetical protein
VTISPHPPGVSLNSPLDDSGFIGEQQIFLDASATDMQDGPLHGTYLIWASSRDGFLGYGEILNFQADTLTEGLQRISVTAIDSLGLTNSTTIQILVLRQAPPELTIAYDDSQTMLSWPVDAVKYILESTPDLGSSNWITVTNAPVAADAQQTLTTDNSGSARFFRLRMR